MPEGAPATACTTVEFSIPFPELVSWDLTLPVLQMGASIFNFDFFLGAPLDL